ncbi:MAG TPA: cellulase family glycosylhydrolase [Planctomycetaceae bacterium]|jgi:hypothetical protein|nr:cellulase family glycosylhydrolase [Planctomycetaceae bacterium]
MERRFAIVLLSAAVLLALAAGRANCADGSHGPFQLELKRDGTFSLLYHQLPLVSADFKFWEADWKWANPTAEAGELHNGTEPFGIRIPGLAADVTGTIDVRTPNVVAYDFTARHSATHPGVKGGGIEFVLDLKSPLFGGQTPPDAVLSPNNEGWSWPLGTGRAITVAFSPGVKKVYFENNNKARIRAFFLGEETSSGNEKIRMTITLPEGTERKPTLDEEFGPADTLHWLGNLFPYPQSPVDLSTLNHQPGTHGFLRAVGNRLVFEDGTPARFWGINVMAYALFSSDAQIKKNARRLAMLGFNLVRLHHHDTTAWVDPTVIDKHLDNSRMLDKRGIDRIDFWIKCLRENGIYVWLDMHSYRQFRAGDKSTELGNVVTYDEFTRERPGHEVKGFCQYDPVLQKLMAEFQEKYLTHVNRYTGVAYKDDPTIAFLLVTNENDITHHYGVRAIPRMGHVELNRLFTERLKRFAGKTGLNENEMRLPWTPGPAQIFLNDQEHAFYSTMIGSIRGTGSRALVAAGNMWGDNPLSSLPSLLTGDVIDVHEYDGPGLLTTDARYKPNIVSSIGIHQVSGKPITVSEWNLETWQEPTVDRFSAPIYVASIAALQGWDALMLYGYSQQALTDQIPVASVWDCFNDPATLAEMPAAALLYRNGHVAPAKKEYCLELSRDEMFTPTIHSDTCAAARTLMEQSRFTLGIPAVPELDWLHPSKPPAGTHVIHHPDESFLPADAHSVTSDTGELKRDWEAGVQTIDTPKTQAAQGAIGDNKIQLSDVTVLVGTRHATVAVSSLDEQPLKSSGLILITTVARAIRPKRLPGRAGWYQVLTVLSEPVRGEVTVRAPAGLQAVKLLSTGGVVPLENVVYEEGRYRIPLQKRLSHWYLLQKPASP